MSGLARHPVSREHWLLGSSGNLYTCES